MTNIRDWLRVATEERSDESPVIIQDGNTPKEDFSDAVNVDTTDHDVAKPATVHLDAASDGAPEQKVIDQGHQEIRISKEEAAATETTESGDVVLKEGAEETTEVSIAPVDMSDDVERDPSGVDGTRTTAHLEPSEAGDQQRTPVADAQVHAHTGGTEVVTSLESFGVDEQYEAEVENVYSKIEAVENDIEHFERVSAAMEAYQTLLLDGAASGKGVDRTTAQAIRIGLEALDSYFVEVQPIASLEAFTEDPVQATTVSLEDFKSSLAQITKVVKQAIEKLFEMLYDLWTRATGGVDRAMARLEKLLEAVDTMVPTSGAKVTLTGTNRLSADGVFVGNKQESIRELTKVAEYIYDEYPKQMEGFVKDVTDLYVENVPMLADLKRNNEKLYHAISSFSKLPRKHLKPLSGMVNAREAELPSDLQKYPGVLRSEALPGNFALVHYVEQRTHMIDRTEIDVQLSIALNFNRVYQIRFAQLPGLKAAPSEVSYDVPNRPALSKTLQELIKLLKSVDRGTVNRAKYAAIKKTIDRAIHNVQGRVGSARVSNDTRDGLVLIRVLVQSLQSLSRLLVQPSGQFTGYVVSTVNAYAGLIAHTIEQANQARGSKPGREAPGRTAPAGLALQPA